MRQLLLCAVLATALLLPSPALAADVIPGQVIAGFKPGTGHSRAEALVQRAGGKVKRHLDRIRAAVVRPRTGTATARCSGACAS